MNEENKELIPTPEIDQFGELNKKLANEEIRETLKKIEIISRKMEVGQQTSYQNRFFVLNPVEFPEGTSGKSRQAIFEAAVRIDVLKGHLFEHKKINGEMKTIEAKLMRAKKKLNSDDEADKLEAEGEIIIAEAEYRQKELSLEAIESKANNILRQIDDFWDEFNKNEELCMKRGFNYENWNNLEVEDDYWNTVNDRKIQKAAAYSLLGMGQQLGDSLPLQNNLDPSRVEFVKQKTIERIQNFIRSEQDKEKFREIEKEDQKKNENWTIELPNNQGKWDSGVNGSSCKFNKNGCTYNSYHWKMFQTILSSLGIKDV